MAPPQPSDRLRLTAMLWVIGTRLGLWVLPFRAVRAAVVGLAGLPSAPRRHPATPQQIGKAVRAATRAMPRATCLTQALSAYALLTRAGHPANLTLGGRFHGETFEAHAWVTCRGEVVTGGNTSGHAMLGNVFEARA